jgi:hypothetical protein
MPRELHAGIIAPVHAQINPAAATITAAVSARLVMCIDMIGSPPQT